MMQTCCAARLLRCVLARRSPYFACTVSRLAAGRLASGPARYALHYNVHDDAQDAAWFVGPNSFGLAGIVTLRANKFAPTAARAGCRPAPADAACRSPGYGVPST